MRKYKANGLIEKRARMGVFLRIAVYHRFSGVHRLPANPVDVFSFQDITYNTNGYHTHR